MLSANLNQQFISLCYSIYPKKITAPFIYNDEQFFSYLKKNRLDDYFTLKYGQEKQEYNQYKKNLISSLKLLKKILGNEPFIVIKTLSSYPHITSDLDVIIKNKIPVSKIKKTNFSLKTDVNNRISWTEDEEISREFVWKNVEEYDFHGIKILVPNPDLDVLIRLAHLPFEQAEIRLGELLHIYRQAKTVNWERLQKEAERNHWLKTFERVRLLLNKLHDGMFNKQRPIRFPYRLSFFLLVQAIIEKKAWRKIWGARYVIKNRLSS